MDRQSVLMDVDQKVNILLVDDQPAKLMSYETILAELDENLIKVASAREALAQLLKQEIAVILVDVCMPELDGFQLGAMIREHPRFQKTAIIFISAVLLTDVDRLRAYEIGAVDYVPVPVVPEVLRAKVRVFSELYRTTRKLERLNQELEDRVAARTKELELSSARLKESEERRSLALAAGQMGSWEWNPVTGRFTWDEGQYRIFGVERNNFEVTLRNVRTLIIPDDWNNFQNSLLRQEHEVPYQNEFCVVRPNGEIRWCISTVVTNFDATDRIVRVSGVTIDITDRKEAEERQALLMSEIDHRARNALALVQSIVRLTRSDTMKSYVIAVEGRIDALSRAHTLLARSRWQGADLARLLDEELAPYRTGDPERIVIGGSKVLLDPGTAQTLALALHELTTNAAKYGALSQGSGRLQVTWDLRSDHLVVNWTEQGGPGVSPPSSMGFGVRLLQASIEGQLQGRIQFEWLIRGLHCTLSVPRDKIIGPKAFHAVGGGGALGEVRATLPLWVAGGHNLLLIEDEILVAMMMRDVFTELGFSVVGPFFRLAEAMVAAMHENFDAAILDVNLGGELVYPVADVLIARQIPFVFVTGFAYGSIEKRFARVPVIQKPVNLKVLQGLFERGVGNGVAETRLSAPH
jgi:PAS domain S-box-containing protein